MRKSFDLRVLALVLFVLSAVISAQEGTHPAAEEKSTAPKANPTTDDKAVNVDDKKVDDEKTGSFWMKQKMRLSTEMLAGLAEGDFEKIGTNASRMHRLNRVERFVRRGIDGYRDELKLFNMANQAVVRAADNENLEAATLAFNRLTVSCVSCHQRLRKHDSE